MGSQREQGPGAPAGEMTLVTQGPGVLARKRLLDFDAVLPRLTTVRACGREIELRDDVPMREVVRVFDIIEAQQQMAEHGAEFTAAESKQAFADLAALTLDCVTAFMQFTRPEMTRDEVDAWLDYDQQLAVVMLFFQTRSEASLRQSAALVGALSAPDADDPTDPARVEAQVEAQEARAAGQVALATSAAQATRARSGRGMTSAASAPSVMVSRPTAMALRSPGRAGATSRRKR